MATGHHRARRASADRFLPYEADDGTVNFLDRKLTFSPRSPIINCYTSEELIEQRANQLRTFLIEMGTDLRQGAVGLVIDRDFLEIAFPLEGETDG